MKKEQRMTLKLLEEVEKDRYVWVPWPYPNPESRYLRHVENLIADCFYALRVQFEMTRENRPVRDIDKLINNLNKLFHLKQELKKMLSNNQAEKKLQEQIMNKEQALYKDKKFKKLWQNLMGFSSKKSKKRKAAKRASSNTVRPSAQQKNKEVQ